MRSINSVVISGNLGRDSELRETKMGGYVLTFSVCVTTSQKTDDGWEEQPNWVDCTLFGRQCKPLADRLKKGTTVTVQGSLRENVWTKDGERKSKIRVIADNVNIHSTKPNASSESGVYADEAIPF